MRLAAVLVLIVASAGCGTSSTAAVVHSPSPAPTSSAPSPLASASPSPSPSPSASSSASPSAPPTPFVFTLPAPVSPPAAAPGGCVLPVYWLDGTSLQAGFLLYPSGTIASSTQTLTHTSEATYDRAVGRWLPVGPEAISPDGLEFAYAEYDLPPAPTAGMDAGSEPRAGGALATTGRVHLMDASSGADRIVYSGSPTYSVAGFTADGIYLAQIAITMDGNFSSGLYLLPLTGGTPAPVAGAGRQMDRGGWTVIGGNAWGADFTPGYGALSGGNEIVELDLHTGVVTRWLTVPANTSTWVSALALLGFDASGYPLVLSAAGSYSGTGSPPPQPPSQVLVLASPQHATVIYQASDPSASVPFRPVFANAQRAWMGAFGSIWVDSANKIGITNVNENSIVGVGGTCQ